MIVALFLENDGNFIYFSDSRLSVNIERELTQKNHETCFIHYHNVLKFVSHQLLRLEYFKMMHLQ